MKLFCLSVTICLFSAGISHAATVDDLIETVQAVNKNGKGHEQAVKALDDLQQAAPSALVPIVRAMKSTNPLSANWLRSAFESIAARAVEKNQLPVKELRELVLDTSQDPRARRMVYEWLLKVDPQLEQELIPKLLKDPSSEFRRDAVSQILNKVEKLDGENSEQQAKALYQQALRGAVHQDQVEKIVKALEGLDVTVDLPRHFGFLTDWKIIGPFNNKDKVGFAEVYPPEKEINLQATYKGSEGEVKWQDISTTDEYGLLDIAEQIENYKGSCMYAATEFDSAKKQEVQLRLGTPNAWKLWVNGKLVFAREEYHRGTAMDQYRVNVNLKKGRNVILFKICQNEQTDSWAQRYQFQLRVCDVAGSAILPADAHSTSSIESIRKSLTQGEVK